MTDYIAGLLDYFIVKKEHHRFRQPREDKYILAREFAGQGLSDMQRATKRLCYVLNREKPVVFKDEKIALLRTVASVPEIFTEEEFEKIKSKHYIHEQGKVCNINPCYSDVIDAGFNAKRKEVQAYLEQCRVKGDKAGEEYLGCTLEVLDAIEAFAGRYREEALRAGNTRVAEIFARIPKEKPDNLREALQFFRLLHYCLWCSFNYHNTVGRFDQYMYHYLKTDLANGTLDSSSALELLEEFFISFNKDSDLYPGMQQGDNGQSMVLGGLDENGADTFNQLSDMCLQASLELKLIDPKINLRVSKKTPLALYEKGTRLTKQGLGFPQYSNDDIVVEALKRWGYEDKDAYNYVVAACWEFILPGVAMDIPNISALSFADAVVKALPKLDSCTEFEEFMQEVREQIFEQAGRLTANVGNIYMEPSPLMSLLMKGCIGRARDISHGSRYNNYGFHGAGLSTAADSLAAIKKYVFEEKTIGRTQLVEMLNNNFEGAEKIWGLLRYDAPKMGNDDDYVDMLACRLLDWFAASLEGRTNDRGGIFRAGTGSAMYYLWQSAGLQATPDGRKKGEAFACNFSPSLFSRCKGPVSIIRSFSKPDLVRVANGGPLTIELHDTVFRNDESIRKVALLIKAFIDSGGHQMQINAVDRDTLIAAKRNPGLYRNLIVRVWGWSGYFVELDEMYQDHIIERMELKL
jgi:pyruvate-formate lyase